MKRIKSSIAIAIGIAFSIGALAQNMSKERYMAANDRIVAEYKFATAACGSLSGNANDICKAEARGNEKISKAQLDARNKPSVDASYDVRVARADAAYSVAKQRCDDKAGNVKDVCVKKAMAEVVAAKADATVQMKTAKANEKAAEASSKANSKASEKSADARMDAAADKRDADYAVAKERCDAFASDAKSTCLKDAEVRFGKS